MGTVISDFYTFLWDIIFKMQMPIRAIVIIIFIVLIVKFIFKLVTPHLIRALFFILCKIMSLIIRGILFIIYNLLINPSRTYLGKIFSSVAMLDDGLHTILELIEKIAKNSNKIPDIFYKYKKKINKCAYISLLLICLWIVLPFTKILSGTRIEKYSFIAENKYYAFEYGVTDGIGIHPNKEIGQITAKNDKSVEVANVKEKYFRLNEKGYNGSCINDKPNLHDSNKITIVSGDIVLLYMNESSTDSDGRVWYKVKAPNGKIGWISGRIVQEVK